MSNAPNGLTPSTNAPVGEVVSHRSSPPSRGAMVSLGRRAARAQPSSHAFKRFGGGPSCPHGQAPPSVPRAAYSHCSSVGSLLPTQRQYAAASSNDTQFIG